MVSITSWAFQDDAVEDWAYVDNVLTPQECAQLITIGTPKLQPAGTYNENNGGRESQTAWLSPEDVEFATRPIVDALLAANEQFFKFDLFGITEGFQFTCYDAPSGHFGLHTDKGFGNAVRKLSLTIQLSTPEDYEGGELALQFGQEPIVMPKELGKMVVFPSYALHEVRPVTKGTRYSLVAWVTGKPFR